ncbi:hypothetical protein ACIJDA_002623 [Enterococcus faecalis]|uniref:hypothetical protein n=1 Tax=Enterococcus faecalis TaxID=1351 RepID=UPI0019F96088|nr:hypothetical protein [Enterococcus faecalis]EGO9069328.1 hypothetical protein [Enterococcus faecalis]ELU9045004.1 hypothetical protein [Enterococcus faecalis]MBO1137687.1 hypothetical protein [Enterococcus faecalis]MDN3114986.1 hypothetical protein [Enterococcus faecalis]
MNKDEFYQLLDNHPSFLKEYLQENLLTKDEAPKYTQQTQGSFDSTAKLNSVIQPFFSKEKNGRTTFKLYLKSEMIEYGKNRRRIHVKKDHPQN